MDFANLEYLEYVVTVVPDETKTYDYFLTNLELFTAPIPRQLWPGKPIGPPIVLYNLFDYGFPIGMTWSVVGEGWQDLGIVGVVIWCMLGGAAWGYFYRWFARSEQTRIQVAIYAITLPLSVAWYRDGILLTIVKFPFYFLVPIILWALMCKFWPIEGRKKVARPSTGWIR